MSKKNWDLIRLFESVNKTKIPNKSILKEQQDFDPQHYAWSDVIGRMMNFAKINNIKDFSIPTDFHGKTDYNDLDLFIDNLAGNDPNFNENPSDEEIAELVNQYIQYSSDKSERAYDNRVSDYYGSDSPQTDAERAEVLRNTPL